MRPAYDTTARKRTVSVTLNGDLYAKAKDAGVNVSQITEAALAAELDRRERERIRSEIAQDLQALNDYASVHGSFAEMTREYLGSLDDGQAV